MSKIYLSQRQQAELDTIRRERKAGVERDIGREQPLDELRFTDRRVHCANCNRVKGSTITNRYFPERPCASCGNTKTILRDVKGNEIYWEKWVILKNEDALNEMASCGVDYHYPDYDYE